MSLLIYHFGRHLQNLISNRELSNFRRKTTWIVLFHTKFENIKLPCHRIIRVKEVGVGRQITQDNFDTKRQIFGGIVFSRVSELCTNSERNFQNISI